MVERTYWQVAAGDRGRSYHEDFIKYGLAFVGGDTYVERMKQVRAGDILILKEGTQRIRAVGEVVERDGVAQGCDGKEWLRDYDGWDLRSWCNVEWRVPAQPVEVPGLTQGTLLRMHRADLQERVDELLHSGIIAVPKPEPGVVSSVSDEEILTALIAAGLRSSVAVDLIHTLNKIRLLARYYFDLPDWDDIREHETRSFLVVPLLLTLGWAEQQLKIELPCEGVGKVDIAGFPTRYDGDSAKCTLIIETKGFSSGLTYAHEQALQYAHAFPACRTVLVTNGYCYKLFTREPGAMFDGRPSGYLNLLRQRSRYPRDPAVPGAIEVLQRLIPAVT